MEGGRGRGRSPLPVSENWKKCLDFGKTPKLLYVVDETSKYVLFFQENLPCPKKLLVATLGKRLSKPKVYFQLGFDLFIYSRCGSETFKMYF